MHDPRRPHCCHRPSPIPSPPLYVRLAIYLPLEIASFETAPGRSSDHPNPPWNAGMARTMRTARTMAWSNPEICFHGNSNCCTCTPRVIFGPGRHVRHPRISASQLISDPLMATGCSPAPKPPFPWRLSVRRAERCCATLGITAVCTPSIILHTSRSTSPCSGARPLSPKSGSSFDDLQNESATSNLLVWTGKIPGPGPRSCSPCTLLPSTGFGQICFHLRAWRSPSRAYVVLVCSHWQARNC
ncbi:uncharacterized protein SCHCODRAFT_02633615 [Schizophyllum commune H4-8]|uniref:uncharacterized protein n=1 Tax=Schizophyllum commune (strain H4-8 / FGSC 9210) TaxID=578458 RepID=UPI002160E3EF|nr:uncharacterized protein SCHCODRAFT_02633615 [Schizophyllum commune H4-8]KAI5889129.1 hypothetical protein SCHCODRAFT_02633615 [Schizophyllum commune H4-8]